MSGISLGRLAGTTLLSWLSMMGFDLFLHAGLLASFYVEPSPFLLSPMEAFRRIPIGYASFLAIAILLVWLMIRLGIAGVRKGFRFGLQMGILVQGAQSLAMLSIATATPALLAAWFLGGSVQMSIGGAVAGSGLVAGSLWRLFGKVIALVLLLVAITVLLQSLGLAPALRV